MASLEANGEKVLAEFCKEFPGARSEGLNHSLPPYFLSKFPEARNELTDRIDPNPQKTPFTVKDQNKLRGIETGQTGDMAERKIFKLLHDWACKSHEGMAYILQYFTLEDRGLYLI